MSVILATGGYDHKIRFWEAPSGICSRTIRFPDSQVNCLEITPDKQFLSAGGNPHIRLYEINSSNHHPVLSCEGHSSNVTSLGFQRDGRWMYSGSEDGTIKIFDLRSPTYQRSFDSRGPVRSVRLHPNQMILMSGDQNGSVKIWDLRMGMTASMNTSLGASGGAGTTASPAGGGSGASTTAGTNGSMNAGGGAGSTTSMGPGGGLLSSSQTRTTPGGGGGGPIVPPPPSGGNANGKKSRGRGESASACINELVPDASTSLPSLPSSATKLMTTSTTGVGGPIHSSSRRVSATSSDGKHATAAATTTSSSTSTASTTTAHATIKTTSISNPNSNSNTNHSTSSSATTTRTSSNTHHTKITPIQSVDITDRTAIAVNANGEVFAWDPTHTTQFRPLAKFRAHPPHSYCLCAKLSPDGRHFVTTGSDCTARLWNTTSWDITTTLAAHQRWVWDAVFSADSSYLVTASSDHSARLWNLRTGEVVRQYTGHQSAVTCVALNDSST